MAISVFFFPNKNYYTKKHFLPYDVKPTRGLPVSCKETFDDTVHRTGDYSAWVGPNGPAFERFPDIIKKINK
jgi:hypothetical protein